MEALRLRLLMPVISTLAFIALPESARAGALLPPPALAPPAVARPPWSFLIAPRPAGPAMPADTPALPHVFRPNTFQAGMLPPAAANQVMGALMHATGPGGSPGRQCRQAIANAERLAGIPDHLLSAIARVESGRRDPQTGEVDPWPWSINVEGTDHVYDTEAEVIAAVRSFQAEGRRSIDVGCLQVNLMYHPDAFATLEQAFDPRINAEYAAKFLTELYRQTGSWEHATANYHSATPELGGDYQRKVMAVLPDEARNPTAPGIFSGPTRMASLTMPVAPAPPGMAHVIQMPAPVGVPLTGRSLQSYRAAPIMLARR